jgi:hypothetical protein
MEKKPVLVKSGKVPEAVKYISAAPVVHQKRGTGPAPNLKKMSDPQIGTGPHPAFNDSKISANVVPSQNVLHLRQNFVPKLYTSLAKDVNDPRAKMAQQGLWSGRKTSAEKQSATPQAVSDSADLAKIKKGKASNWGGSKK